MYHNFSIQKPKAQGFAQETAAHIKWTVTLLILLLLLLLSND